VKHQVIAITGCIAATTSISGIANTLPENLLGLNLGEISTNSFINKPFKGVIPLHSISYTNAKNLDVKLASPAIFNQIGAEMHPVLNNLSFNIVKQSGKPVILISSDQPVQLPFLNFILEIQGPDEGIVYQDYTVLLDPETKQVPNQSINSEAYTSKNKPLQKKLKNKQKYKVKSGDTLSIIAKSHKIKNVSLKKMSQAIYKKNPRAFVKGDRNKIKRGYALKLPTVADIRNFENTSRITKKKLKKNKGIGPVVHASSSDKYVVTKGDTLSKITRKFVNKDNSFTQLMNAIYINNPEAFVQKNKSLIKSGVELDIPLVADKLKNDENNIQNEDNPISVSTTPFTPSKNTLAKSLNENNEIKKIHN